MTQSLAELLTQRDAVERQIREAQSAGKQRALAEVRKLMSEHGLTVSDLSTRTGATKSGGLGGSKVAAKYRDPASGATWSGRGLRPKWLAAAVESGKSLIDFAL